MYAIIATGGKQYKVSTGDKVRVEKLDKEVGDKVSFKEVLLISDGTVTVGNPYVEGALVEATVVEIRQDIANGDYDSALIKANTLHMDVDWSSESEQHWNKEREALIKLIEQKKEEEGKQP